MKPAFIKLLACLLFHIDVEETYELRKVRKVYTARDQTVNCGLFIQLTWVIVNAQRINFITDKVEVVLLCEHRVRKNCFTGICPPQWILRIA